MCTIFLSDWPRATRWVAKVLADLLQRPVEPGSFYNVNLPHLSATDPEPAMVECALDPSPLPLSYREEENGHHHYDGLYASRERIAKSDVDICFGGAISVTNPSRAATYSVFIGADGRMS